ncbi:MAG: inorganic phosphate transporter [Nitrososphaerales archaeon]
MMYSIGEVTIVFLGILAAWSMGHHYSGAVVGTAYGSRAIGMKQGLMLSGLLVVIGALLSTVVSTYVSLAAVGPIYSIIVLTSFVVMSNLTTHLKIPTSTIQLYVFSLLGAALATGARINFQILILLVVSWVAAPAIAHVLGGGCIA